MSLLGWVLVGLAIWVVVAVVIALVLARLVCGNSHSMLDGMRTPQRPDPAPGIAEAPDLPSPRDGAHDEAETADRRRPRE